MKILGKIIIGLLLLCSCFERTAELRTPPFKESRKTPPGERQLNWIGYWKDEEKKELLVREISREFSFTHPGVSVNLRFPQEIKELGIPDPGRMASFIAGLTGKKEKPWDVIWMNDMIYYYVGEILGDQDWGPKYLVNFNQVPGFPETQKVFIINGKNYRSKTGGILPGPYLEGFLNLFWYNRQVAREIGLEIKERGCSFREFLEYLEKGREYSRSRGDLTLFFETRELNSVNILFQNLFISEVGYINVLRKNWTNRKKAALRKVLEAFEQMGHYSPLDRDFREKTLYNSPLEPLRRDILFFPGSSGVITFWKSQAPEIMSKMIPMEIPSFEGINDAAQGGYTPTWGVFKDAPNKDLAIKLMKYIASPRIGEKWSQYTKTPTGIRGNLFNVQYIEDHGSWARFRRDIYDMYGDNLLFFINTSYLFGEENPGLKEELEERLVALLEKRLTGKQAYEQLMSFLKNEEADD